MEDSWKTTEFIVLNHKDSKDVFILGNTDDIQQLLDDSNINVATIASSRHVGPIKSKVDAWQRDLELFDKTLVGKVDNWTFSMVTVQRTVAIMNKYVFRDEIDIAHILIINFSIFTTLVCLFFKLKYVVF